MDWSSILLCSNSVMLVSAMLTFLGLSFFAAPYGKYSTEKGFGPLLPAQISWAVMESPNLWISLLVWYYRGDMGPNTVFDQSINKVAMFCFLLHYSNRSIIYPLRMSSSKATPMPLSVMLAAFVFCSWNGFNQAVSLIVEGNEVIANSSITDWRCLAGMSLFFFGFCVNVTSDNILINSKKKAEKKLTDSKYVIPEGGMFKFVSCANYCKLELE